jgi:predicted RNA binding protein YcfA (HicA-like mRNA interferase family)
VASRKRPERMCANPRDWRIEDVEAVARAIGANVRRSSGSHVVLEHPLSAQGLSIPARRPIKPVYIVRLVAWIDAIERSGR